MTTLMIKTHNKTGLKYFCKTTRTNSIYTYLGSGKYWKRHLKKHGKDISTEIVAQYDDSQKDLLTETALKFSKGNDIVKSDEWANLIPENGLDGGSEKGRFSEAKKKEIYTARTNNPNWVKGKTYEEIMGKEKAERLMTIRRNTTKGKYNKGAKNPRAGIVTVYDANGNEQYIFEGTIRTEGKDLGLPVSAIIKSYLNGGKPLYMNITDNGNLTRLANKGWLGYKGWYAIKKDRYSK